MLCRCFGALFLVACLLTIDYRCAVLVVAFLWKLLLICFKCFDLCCFSPLLLTFLWFFSHFPFPLPIDGLSANLELEKMRAQDGGDHCWNKDLICKLDKHRQLII